MQASPPSLDAMSESRRSRVGSPSALNAIARCSACSGGIADAVAGLQHAAAIVVADALMHPS
ncbi:hypothetical protein GCM10009846_13710 [Agrococcus versicolor]|uniref:Uncharacterized protein n=1 Tax=Agrococcus versicolor TaxID=501482 RepID=A0ABN3API3_9MICO